MATTKVIFVALLAAFALQASASRAPAIKGAFDDVIDLAEHVLKLVTTVVDDAIEIATTSMNTVITKLEDFQQNADKYAKQIVEAELKVLNELIDDFKDNTDGIVKEVLECVESVEGDLSDLEEYALKEAAVCTNGSIATVVQDAEQFVTDFSQVSKQVEAQADALEECKSQLIPISCIQNVVEELINIVASVPAQMNNDIAKIEDDWKALESKVKACADDVIPNLQTKAKLLEDDFIKCIV